MSNFIPPDNPRHIISHALAEHCDLLMPEQARKVIEALEGRGYKIVKFNPPKLRPPMVIEDDLNR